MNKLALATIISLFWISYRANQYFEDKLSDNHQNQVLGISRENRFFLPLPDKYEIITKDEESRSTKLIIKSSSPITELKDFYKEILRSKGYENDYEYDKDNISEIRYLSEKEDIKITFTQNEDYSLIEFNYHY